MNDKTLIVEDDDFDMYISRSKQQAKKNTPEENDILFEEAKEKAKPKKKVPKKKEEPKVIVEETQEKVEEPIEKEEVVEVKEVITEEKKTVIEETVISKEDLILQKLAYLEQGIDNIIEAIPEMVNQSISDYKDLKTKIALLEESVIYNSKGKPKIINFFRNEEGLIDKAEIG